MNTYTYKIESVLWYTPRVITTDQNTADLIFNALCDFYHIDDDEIDTHYRKEEFISASATFEINGKRYTITIKRVKK